MIGVAEYQITNNISRRNWFVYFSGTFPFWNPFQGDVWGCQGDEKKFAVFSDVL
jgi:hypothetical protein